MVITSVRVQSMRTTTSHCSKYSSLTMAARVPTTSGLQSILLLTLHRVTLLSQTSVLATAVDGLTFQLHHGSMSCSSQSAQQAVRLTHVSIGQSVHTSLNGKASSLATYATHCLLQQMLHSLPTTTTVVCQSPSGLTSALACMTRSLLVFTAVSTSA